MRFEIQIDLGVLIGPEIQFLEIQFLEIQLVLEILIEQTIPERNQQQRQRDSLGLETLVHQTIPERNQQRFSEPRSKPLTWAVLMSAPWALLVQNPSRNLQRQPQSRRHLSLVLAAQLWPADFQWFLR